MDTNGSDANWEHIFFDHQSPTSRRISNSAPALEMKARRNLKTFVRQFRVTHVHGRLVVPTSSEKQTLNVLLKVDLGSEQIAHAIVGRSSRTDGETNAKQQKWPAVG